MLEYKINEYDRYLESEEWKQIRDNEIKNHPFCTFCGKTENLQVHHCDYSKSPHLIVLCRGCHEIISEMVMNYNNSPWKDRLDSNFAPEIVKKYIIKVYKEQYCKNPDKTYNFLNYSHIKEVCNLFSETLRNQAKFDGIPYDIKPIISKRLSHFYCQAQVQEAISGYRKQYRLESKIAGEPEYSVKKYLGEGIKSRRY